MTKQTISVVIFYKQDGTTAQGLAYEYDSSSQEDIIATASTVANAIYSVEEIGNKFKAALGVRVKSPADFNPYLMAAIRQVTDSAKWNISMKRTPADGPPADGPPADGQVQPSDVE